MRGLRQDEDGAVAVVVAILLLVLIGMAALVVDVGGLYQERRELQNGADAGALALAAECAEGLINCADQGVLAGAAKPYADENAHDGESAVPPTMPHGDEPDTCEPTSTAYLNPLTDGNIVKVSTETLESGDSFVSHLFAPVLGFDGGTVRACAVAGWGPPSGATTIPLTFSFCEWDILIETDPTTGDYIFPSDVETIYYHETNEADATNCNGPAGQDTSGGFGWLETDGDCEATIDADQDAGTDTGADVPNSCKDGDFWQSLVDDEIQVLIPIFTEVTGEGNNAEYHIDGFAAFQFTAYRLQPGNAYTSTPPPECHTSSACMEGKFTDYIDYGDDLDLDGEDYGAVIVTLIG